MNENMSFFNKENMLSILGIEIDKNHNVEFIPESYGLNTTSYLVITLKDNETSSLFIENIETDNYLLSTFEVEPKLSSIGTLTLPLTINHPKIKDAIHLVNQYIKVFMAIYPVETFNNQDHLTLTFHIEYTQKLEISNVTVVSELFKYYSWYSGAIVIIIEHYINSLLNCIEMDCINTDSDIDKIIELLKMQDLVTEMNMI